MGIIYEEFPSAQDLFRLNMTDNAEKVPALNRVAYFSANPSGTAYQQPNHSSVQNG